jgi:hypothetical protein
MRTNFILASGLYKAFIDQMKADKSSRDVTIAAVGTSVQEGRHLKKGLTTKPGMCIELRHYTKDEYNKLSAAHKYGLKLKRDADPDGGKKKKGWGRKKPATVTLSKRSIKALASEINNLHNDENNSDHDSEPDETEVPMKAPAGKKQNKNPIWPTVRFSAVDRLNKDYPPWPLYGSVP